MSEDLWKHRSENMLCSTCMWFVLKEITPIFAVHVGELPPDLKIMPGKIVAEPSAIPISTPQSNVGRCRRHAPTMSGYPVTYNVDWCGDHKLDETKVST